MSPPRPLLLARTAVLAAMALWAVGSSVLQGCSHGRSNSPYAATSEGLRNPVEAERLNQAAAEIIHSDPTRAEVLLGRALTADLYHGPAHNNLGTLLLKRGELYEAAAEFEWARKLMPGHPDPRLNLALTLEAAGRTDEALSTYRTALQVYPDHIATLQALTRLQIRAGRTTEDTQEMLAEVSLRGENEEWKSWARMQMAKSR